MPREQVTLECEQCSHRNYKVTKSQQTTARVEFKKYCRHCARHTIHRESR
ncbi:MAG: 50S ribosomal protein L33 [Gemmatimonadetes bacterium]|nr:50S ribosomal protein L33 [Gemmatimonadota bacterium]MBT5055676.1 50S ribosomal protein L33 [Gemmatimonadota bacterium]MBT5143839.1 50S ribosomal protein L33 [Gemmatimonadota bacterium]MBT5590606.1 50S ribosomal protein L33 [Gemmatimonadota bacterium]MBT5965523.1 50S ribosomal protein L33 [Gemmatimonadota bacterium]